MFFQKMQNSAKKPIRTKRDWQTLKVAKKDPSTKNKPLVASQIAPTRQTDYGPVCNGQVIPSGKNLKNEHCVFDMHLNLLSHKTT